MYKIAIKAFVVHKFDKQSKITNVLSMHSVSILTRTVGCRVSLLFKNGISFVHTACLGEI